MLLKKLLIIFCAAGLVFTGCSTDDKPGGKPQPVVLPEVQLSLHFQRFERDLFKIRAVSDSNAVNRLRNEYGEFFEIWLTRLSGVLSPVQQNAASPLVAANLSQYLEDPYILEVNRTCDSAFADLQEEEELLSDAFKRYKYLFPAAAVPRLITYTSPFTSNVMAMDSLLGAGLHFYLGENYKYYPSLGLPRYMIRRFDRAYLINDLVKGWLDSEFVNDSTELNCLSQMLYQGKLLYLTEILCPEIHDTILTGYSEAQLEWAGRNEYRIWTFLVENQLIYNSNPKEYIRFINDGNGTNGFSPEAPAKLGVFTGWQIIRSFMKNNSDITPKELMQLNNAQLVLSKSAYKPSRND